MNMRIASTFLLTIVLLISSAVAQTNPPETPWSGIATNAQGETIATISVDASEALDVAAWAKHAGELCAEWYPKISALLASDGFTPPKTVTLRFKNMRGVAGTGGNEIGVSAEYVRRHTNDWGMVIHELTHVVQSYPPVAPEFGWMTEGIADYIRLAHFEPDVRPPRINPDRAKYTDSYKTTAAFLRWIEKAHDPAIVKKLNQSLREQKFKLELFKDYTGKTVDELWGEFTDSIRAQQKPVGQ